jgi:hypothetical protein
MVAVPRPPRAGRRPADSQMLAMHAPEGLGLGLEPEEDDIDRTVASRRAPA